MLLFRCFQSAEILSSMRHFDFVKYYFKVSIPLPNPSLYPPLPPPFSSLYRVTHPPTSPFIE